MESGEESPEEAALTSQSWKRCERPSLGAQGREKDLGKLLTTIPIGSGVVPGLWIVTGTMAATKGTRQSPTSLIRRNAGSGSLRCCEGHLGFCGRPLSIPVCPWKLHQPCLLSSVAGLVCRITPHWTAGQRFL